MKTKLAVVLAFLLSAYLYGQKNDLTKLNLKGNIKSIHESYYQIMQEKGKAQREVLDLSYLNTFDTPIIVNESFLTIL